MTPRIVEYYVYDVAGDKVRHFTLVLLKNNPGWAIYQKNKLLGIYYRLMQAEYACRRMVNG